MQDFKYFLKDYIRREVDFSSTAQSRGIAPPPLEKPAPENAEKISLPGSRQWKTVKPVHVAEAIAKRRSRRTATKGDLLLSELSFLLWTTQGIREKQGLYHALRTVPSAGCRHSFETYIACFRVTGLEKAIYRYLPVSHELVKESAMDNLEKVVTRMALGQSFAGKSAATFIWTTVTARMEWRYAKASYKVIALDAGHVCQNLYLACEAINCGTCAIAAYDQHYSDTVLGVDGEEEFTIYMAPVSKL
ncbi:MAG: SagB/ThcOx family dehydrogenase [Desulfobacterales bacterium]